MMRFGGRLACLLIGILGLSVVTAPLIKVAIDWLLRVLPETSQLLGLGYADGSYNFGRIYRRLLLVLILLLGYLGRRWLGPISLRGIGARCRMGRQLGSGLLLGCLSFALLLSILILLGKRSLAPDFPANWLLRIVLALGSGLIVGTIEETIFRGFLLGGLLQGRSRFVAILLSSGLFSLPHFLWAKVPVTSGLDFAVGLRALATHFRALAQPAILSPFIGLLLVGTVLAYAYLWTNSLPFVIGLHAGWVFLGKIDGFLLLERTGVRWLYGQQGILAGALGWTFILLMLPLLRLWTRQPSELQRPRHL
ncbi:MAG: CPBP family intramembrane glutamic endopeptidase [Candidatus Methylomirabilales bacterium]